MPAYWKARPDACDHTPNAHSMLAIWAAASSALSPRVSTLQVMGAEQAAQPASTRAGAWPAKIEVKSAAVAAEALAAAGALAVVFAARTLASAGAEESAVATAEGSGAASRARAATAEAAAMIRRLAAAVVVIGLTSLSVTRRVCTDGHVRSI